MHTMRRKLLPAALFVAATVIAAVGLAPTASAGPMINAGACVPGSYGAQCAAAAIATAISSPGDLSVASQTVGAFTLSGSAIASTTPTSVLFDSQTITLSTVTGGLLNVYFTVNGVPTADVPLLFSTTFTSNNQTATTHAATLASYLSDTNGLFNNGEQIQLADASLTSAVVQTAGPDSITETPGATVSVTEVYQIELLGCSVSSPCTANLTTDLTASQVPEPASIALLGVGILGLGIVVSRKRSV